MAAQLLTPEYYRDPYVVYARLRQESPILKVAQTTSGEAWLITRYDDVVSVLKDPRFSNERRKVVDMSKAFINRRFAPSIFRAFFNSMVLVDDPHHARLRMLVHKAFTPRMIEQMDTRIQAICNELLDKMAQKPIADLMTEFALPFPLAVIADLMGVPGKDHRLMHRWMNHFIERPSGRLGGLIQMNSILALSRFLNHLIKTRRTHPTDDLVSALVQAEESGDQLSQEELVAMLFLLLFAGHETTVNLIGSGTLALLQNPEQFAMLKAHPSLLDSAIEELLRYTNPVQQIAPRYALEAIQVGDQLIPKGSTVLLSIASANRDERIFPNGETLDITRTPNKHVAFGFGIHYCLGAPLARMEARIGFQALFNRFPNIQLATSADQLQWRNNPSLRGLAHLPVRLNG